MLIIVLHHNTRLVTKTAFDFSTVNVHTRFLYRSKEQEVQTADAASISWRSADGLSAPCDMIGWSCTRRWLWRAPRNHFVHKLTKLSRLDQWAPTVTSAIRYGIPGFRRCCSGWLPVADCWTLYFYFFTLGLAWNVNILSTVVIENCSFP